MNIHLLHQQDLNKILEAIHTQNFKSLGEIAESNALFMHQTMADSAPSISFSTPETLRLQEKIWTLRSEGLAIYFTQDAGPNLKLIYERKNQALLKNLFYILFIFFSYIIRTRNRNLKLLTTIQTFKS